MEQQIHELAEQLERKRLTSLRLNLSGVFLAGGTWILNTYLIHSGLLLVWIIIGLGTALWAASLFSLAMIRAKINAEKALQQLFNDELSALQKLKTWKVGFIALTATLLLLFLISLFITLDAQFILQLSLFVAVISVIVASIVQEEMLSIAVFQDDFDTERYQVWNWKHWAFFHWILNPGVALNELAFGQRVPKVLLIDKQSDKPLMERNHVPCPHCNTIHDARNWSAQNKTAFGHWYGFYCPSCGEIIPCMQNIFSYIILTITYPFRYPFLAGSKKRWLEKQPARFENISLGEVEFKKVNWLQMGLKFGAIMFVFMTFFMAGTMSSMENEPKGYWDYILDPYFLGVNLVCWTLGGLAFGRGMKYLMGPKSPMFKSKAKHPG